MSKRSGSRTVRVHSCLTSRARPTGYRRQEELVRKLFGEAVEKRVGTIWGFGEAQELRNMYTRTKQPGLWLIAGGLAQCRIGSKHLALQIKAIEEGLLQR